MILFYKLFQKKMILFYKCNTIEKNDLFIIFITYKLHKKCNVIKFNSYSSTKRILFYLTFHFQKR